MAETDVAREVQNLGCELAELRPLVHEVHSNMPRIALALETLAAVTTRQEANIEDHKRLHYRISDVEKKADTALAENKSLRQDFDELHDEHLVCTTTQKVERRQARSGLVARLRAKLEDKALEILVTVVLGFCGWMVYSHWREYQKSVKVIGGIVRPFVMA